MLYAFLKILPLIVKNPPASTGDIRDWGSITRQEELLGEEWQPTPVSCLENPRNREVWRALVHGVAESDTTEVT